MAKAKTKEKINDTTLREDMMASINKLARNLTSGGMAGKTKALTGNRDAKIKEELKKATGK